jgi:hypothetical protein
MTGQLFLVAILSIFLVQVRGIKQKDTRHFNGRGRRQNSALKSLGAESRQVTDVIDMGMGYQNCLDIGRIERQRFPVLDTQRLGTLEHAAIDENPAVICLKQVFRSGDSVGCSMEGKFDHRGVYRQAVAALVSRYSDTDISTGSPKHTPIERAVCTIG